MTQPDSETSQRSLLVKIWRIVSFSWLFSWLYNHLAPRQRYQYTPGPRAQEPFAIPPGPAPSRKRPGEVQPPPALVEDPESPAVVKPWEEGGVTNSLDPEEIRPHLMQQLFEASDGCSDAADKEFITRLIRTLGTDKLDLPPFPDVAWQLDTLLRLSDPPLVKVVKLVRREAALVRRVWTQACSAYYARPPNSLDHAVARIGFDSLWRIGMSTCLYSGVFRVRGFQEQADEVRRHGIVAADVASWISGMKLGPAYLSGLLHGVGKLLVYKAASPRKPGAMPSEAFVERICQEHHAAIGVLVAIDWKLGVQVAGGIGYYHDPDQAPAEHQETARQVQAANIAAHTARLSRSGNDCGGLLTLLGLEGLQFDVGRTIGKAHEVLESLDALPDALVLDVVKG